MRSTILIQCCIFPSAAASPPSLFSCFLGLWSCSFKFPFWENPFLQNLHWYDLSPVCVRSCPVNPVKYPVTENLFSQNLHRYSFSPVCIRSCPAKCPFNENPFLQILHVNDFSCLVNTSLREDPYPHILHWNNFSPACVHLCSVKFPFKENTLSQN